ncbi:hypothetical protein ABMA28_005934 [Loxostege sticticalis]|uniref:Uncharacterized protein n=1 Tax=Loxostege sticticalis TaxID=481309 RepID=A0ABD0SNE0_LOXSC
MKNAPLMKDKDNYRQERAEIKYFNPKYVQNAQAFTGRRRRGDPYRTNITATLIKPWGNNVTVEFSYRAKGMPSAITISVKICDVIKRKWMMDFMKTYSDVKLYCPVPAGTYRVDNIELPPKNFPLPIPKGDIHINITHYMTQTKEVVMHTTLLMHTV